MTGQVLPLIILVGARSAIGPCRVCRLLSPLSPLLASNNPAIACAPVDGLIFRVIACYCVLFLAIVLSTPTPTSGVFRSTAGLGFPMLLWGCRNGGYCSPPCGNSECGNHFLKPSNTFRIGLRKNIAIGDAHDEM